MKAPSLWPMSRNVNISQFALLLYIHLIFTTGKILGLVLEKEKNKRKETINCSMEKELGWILFVLVLEDMNAFKRHRVGDEVLIKENV